MCEEKAISTTFLKGPGRFAIPPLEPGDHLTRDEFERRYDAMPNLKMAELLEGVVYMPAATREYHSRPHHLNVKLRVYQRNGVKEYVVWRVLDEAVDWFVLQGTDYVKQTRPADGLHKSAVFPGLWVDPDELVRQSMDLVLKTLDRGLASPEHQTFVKQLNYQPKR